MLVFATASVALGLVACGEESPTLADYADEVEPAVAIMRTRILATDDALAQPASSLDEAEDIWRERAAAREEFLDTLATIAPPEQAASLHGAAEDIVARLAEVEGDVADQIRDYEELPELGQLGTTPAFRDFISVNEEATTVCLAAQGMFDETTQREVLAGMPWLTDEMAEVVEVVFGCVPNES